MTVTSSATVNCSRTLLHLHPCFRALGVQLGGVHAFQGGWEDVALARGLGAEIVFQYVLSCGHGAGEECDAVVPDVYIGVPEAPGLNLLVRGSPFRDLAA